MTNSKTANELIDEAGKHPTLDEVLARDPRDVTDANLAAIVAHSRQERAMFEAKEASAEDRKRKKK